MLDCFTCLRRKSFRLSNYSRVRLGSRRTLHRYLTLFPVLSRRRELAADESTDLFIQGWGFSVPPAAGVRGDPGAAVAGLPPRAAAIGALGLRVVRSDRGKLPPHRRESV